MSKYGDHMPLSDTPQIVSILLQISFTNIYSVHEQEVKYILRNV